MIEYASKWKQLLIYTIRNASIEATRREELYGIQFTNEQLLIIEELMELADGLTLQDIDANPIFESCESSNREFAEAEEENGSEETDAIDNDMASDGSDSDEDESDEGLNQTNDHSMWTSATELANGSSDTDCIRVLLATNHDNQGHQRRRSIKWIRFVEKVMQLSIAFIT